MDANDPTATYGSHAAPTVTIPPPRRLGVTACDRCGRRVPLDAEGLCSSCVERASGWAAGRAALAVELVEQLLDEARPAKADIMPAVVRYCTDEDATDDLDARRHEARRAEIDAAELQLAQLHVPARFAELVQDAAVSHVLTGGEALSGDHGAVLEVGEDEMDRTRRMWALAREIAAQRAVGGDVQVVANRDDLTLIVAAAIDEATSLVGDAARAVAEAADDRAARAHAVVRLDVMADAQRHFRVVHDQLGAVSA